MVSDDSIQENIQPVQMCHKECQIITLGKLYPLGEKDCTGVVYNYPN